MKTEFEIIVAKLIDAGVDPDTIMMGKTRYEDEHCGSPYTYSLLYRPHRRPKKISIKLAWTPGNIEETLRVLDKEGIDAW